MRQNIPSDILDYKSTSSGLYIPKDYNFFVKPNDYNVTLRKLEEYNTWSNFVQWGRKNPILFAEKLIGIEFMDYQKYIFMMSWNTPYVVWCCSRNAGKALDLNTPIPLPDGSYKKMGDIQVGDVILGNDGQATKVLNTSEIFLGNDCYKISFDDQEDIIADADHIWHVKYCAGTGGSRRKGRLTETDKTTRELYNTYLHEHNGNKECIYTVDMAKAIEYPEQELPLDPYILGLWLGSGKACHGAICCSVDKVNPLLKILSKYNCTRSGLVDNTNGAGGNKILTLKVNGNTLKSILNDLGMLKNKHIPQKYLYSSIEQRMELLRGLMDSKGLITPRELNPGLCTFTHLSKEVSEQFGELLTSLGIKYYTKIHEKTRFSQYSFYSNTESPCFKLPQLYNELPSDLPDWTKQKRIINIEKVSTVPTKCLYVDNDSHLYLCGQKNTVTHNSILGAIFIMCKTLLIPNHTSYILCGVGSQSIEMFTKIEKLVERTIPSFRTLTDFYAGEIQKNAANGNGFVHNPASYHFETFNDSAVYTLNGAAD